jgi:hypothetical protein
MTCTNLKGQKFTLQVSGPHHVSAMEAFPAAAGVADRSAGPDGVGPQAGYGATPVPSPAFSPLNMAGPGKRRLPWAGLYCHCIFSLHSVCGQCCIHTPAPPPPPFPFSFAVTHPSARLCATQDSVEQLLMNSDIKYLCLVCIRSLHQSPSETFSLHPEVSKLPCTHVPRQSS